MKICYASKLEFLIISKFLQVQFKRSQSINLHSAKYLNKSNSEQQTKFFEFYRF